MSVLTRSDQQLRNIDQFGVVISEGFIKGNLDALDVLFHEEFVEHQRGFPTKDLNGLKLGIEALRQAIPDIQLEIVDTIVEGDKMSFLLSGTGTHLGPMGPIPASGTPLAWQVIDICRFQDERIIEHWGIPDRMGIMEQIGIPRPPRWLRPLLARRARRR